MHIAINGWFVSQTTAGSGQYIDRMLAHLPQQAPAVRFSLLLPEPSGGLPPEQQPARWPGVAIVPLPRPPLPENLAKLWWEQLSVPWTARRLQADLLWVPYWAAPWWQPLPVAVTVHDLIPLLLPAYRGGPLQRGYTALVAATARRSAAVITVSQASARAIVEQLGIPAARVFPIHHGPNQEDIAALDAVQRERVQAAYGLPERFFLYLGGFDVRKNVEATLRAYSRYLAQGGDPTLKLVIAGRLPARHTPFAPDPRQISAALGLGDAVHFTGWVAEADKPALYALATAFLFPSLYEGFGMMVLEAMAAGTPVITSRI